MSVQEKSSDRVVSMFCDCNKANMDSVQSLKFCHSMLLLIIEDLSSLWLFLSGPVDTAGCQKINKQY